MLRAYLEKVSAAVDAELDRLLPSAGEGSGRLNEAMRYAVLGGGKRLRPALVLAACEAVGSEAEKALPVACALEMVHAYSLAHDDLPAMDDDDLRRGRPTLHKAFDEALAILAGDALLTHAFSLLADFGASGSVPPETALRLVAELAQGAGPLGMVGGQVEDLEAAGQPGGDLASLRHIHELKTGALFRTSVRFGALVGGAGVDDLAALDAFVHHFGVAFQIADDLLDVTGDAVIMGKNVGSDTRLGKLTYPALLGLEQTANLARSEAVQATAALERFGTRAQLLIAMADFAVSRQR